MTQPDVRIIGAGLSGSEAALQLAQQGIRVELWEMRPHQPTPAHQTPHFAELVCSNSFKGLALTGAHGLFKAELQLLGSKLLTLAYESQVPAGESLTVDRLQFSQKVTEVIENTPNIQIRREEFTQLDPHQLTLIAAGPLVSDELSNALQDLVGEKRLAFFDSIAPVVERDSLDDNHCFSKNRWEKGLNPDFINCPLNKEQYLEFVQALQEADSIEPKPFEKGQLFEGCLPIEEMAKRGVDTLRFGPLRPIGLDHPVTGERPYAVLQLRAENESRTLYNLVGCQTRLRWGTQKEIFKIIPALQEAQYVRLGAMHRNTFLNTPQICDRYLRIKGTQIFIAGQISGAEGYTEALGTGLFAATQIYSALKNQTPWEWSKESCLGSLVDFLVSPHPDFQPMNFNFGLLPPLTGRIKKKDRKAAQVENWQKQSSAFRLPWN